MRRSGTALAMAVAMIGTGMGGGSLRAQATGAQVPASGSAVPDAPTPQTLPDLNPLTPVGAPAPAPTAASQAPDAAVQENGGVTPGISLPAAPSASAQNPDDGAAPDLPAPEDAVKAFALPSVQVNFVPIPVTVKDSKGHLVPALTWRDFRIYENGLRQQMRIFSAVPFPLSVALVIDQSVTFDTMEKINSALGALQGAFSASDEVAVFTYNNGVTKQTGFTAAQSARLGVILDRSKGQGRDPVMGLGGPLAQTTVKNNQQVDPNTTPVRNQQGISLNVPREFHTLNDAIFAAAQETTRAGNDRRRVVYVISDGKEYGSKTSQKEVIRYLQTNKIAVYATLVGDSSLPGMGFLDRIHLPLTMRDDVLPRYAAATGGQVDPEFRPRGIENSFAKITEEVRTQYTIGYYSHESPLDEKFRHVEVRVMRPGLTVIAPDGYYPRPSSNRNSGPASAVSSPTP